MVADIALPALKQYHSDGNNSEEVKVQFVSITIVMDKKGGGEKSIL